jgi:hypothetical protein
MLGTIPHGNYAYWVFGSHQANSDGFKQTGRKDIATFAANVPHPPDGRGPPAWSRDTTEPGDY